MKRLLRIVALVFVLGSVLVFAGALFGGLMDDSAFTEDAKGAAH